MRVLVVDDFPGAVEASRILFEVLGHECRTATTGRQALEEAERFAPDVVLLDIGLPDLSGYEVARELRARIGSSVFIAAVTGWVSHEAQAKGRASGIDLHLRKPPTRATLEQVILSARGR